MLPKELSSVQYYPSVESQFFIVTDIYIALHRNVVLFILSKIKHNITIHIIWWFDI